VAEKAEGLSERLTGLGIRLGWKVISRLPESWARGAFMAAADIAWRRQGPGVQRLEANLRRVIGYESLDPEEAGAELRELSREGLRSYARYYLEAFRLQTIPAQRILDGMHCEELGEQTAFEHMKNGRGVLFVLPHMGNFEQAGAWIVLRGAGRFVTIAERLKPESVFQAFTRFRESIGMEVVPLTGGPSAFGVVSQRLRAGGLACILLERDLKDTGVEVDFFGEKAKFAPTAALAVHTGAALMPVVTWFEGEHDWGAHIYQEIPVPETGDRKEKVRVMTQQIAAVFEQAIREHPQDWHMLQRVFSADVEEASPEGPPPRTSSRSGGE
jgi:phosphatidylinositol dimannoside acyltransferase